jgi:hypothetical protein
MIIEKEKPMRLDLSGGRKEQRKKKVTISDIKKALQPLEGEVKEEKEVKLTPEMKARIIKRLRLLEDE